jgi:hypothetical protein
MRRWKRKMVIVNVRRINEKSQETVKKKSGNEGKLVVQVSKLVFQVIVSRMEFRYQFRDRRLARNGGETKSRLKEKNRIVRYSFSS